MNSTINHTYINYIYDLYKNQKDSPDKDLSYLELSKIFEYFSCIKLTEKYNTQFYEYKDIDPTFKEDNYLSRQDTRIDLCNLTDTIVQCKLRGDYLNWKECSTFFASQICFDDITNTNIIKWKNLIITRNSESKISKNLKEKSKMFKDFTYSKQELIKFCDNLLLNPPTSIVTTNDSITLKNYQTECISLIQNSQQNISLCLPTGSGKNIIILYSFKKDEKYLILVPRIILMEQLKDEIIKRKPEFKNNIQLIGDSNKDFNIKKNITICVYISSNLIFQVSTKYLLMKLIILKHQKFIITTKTMSLVTTLMTKMTLMMIRN